MVAVSVKKEPCIKNCISTDGGTTWTKENANLILIQQNFELGETYTTIKKTDTKIINILIETALVTILIYVIVLPFAKRVNKLKFDTKLIRKLYFKKNKKSDDPL